MHTGTDKLCQQGEYKEKKVYTGVSNVSLVIVQSWLTNGDEVQAK